jgi:dTDP-4-amino-4,6-dideoxygalactose transaminase
VNVSLATTIPLVDLRAQHDEVRTEIEAALRSVLDESGFIGGSSVSDFEAAFAGFCGARHGIAISTGTDALELTLRACGIGAGDVVLTASHTFIGTVEGAVQLGAVPRFFDIDPATYTLDPELLRAYLAEQCQRASDGTMHERESGLRVGAIIPVHLYGLTADMAAILALGQEYGVPVIEDACQAHGAEYRLPDGTWKRAGTMGRAGCFSFYPGKNLGALGEGGGIVTDDAALDEQVRVLRDHGQSERYIHSTAYGVNARLDAFKAAVLHIKLARLEAWNAHRRQVAAWYYEQLADTALPLPSEPAGTRHVYHQYVVRVPADERARIRTALDERGISTGLHYPIPLHRQPAFEHLGLEAGTLPHAERAANEVLSLPMHPHLTHEDVVHIASSLRDAIR